MTTYFISGHRYPSSEAKDYYITAVKEIAEESQNRKGDLQVVIGDYHGIDIIVQNLIKDLNKRLEYPIPVIVYHMFDEPRNNAGFPTKGGYISDFDRDFHMSMESDVDIAFVDKGKEKSGTQQNLDRRDFVNGLKKLSKEELSKVMMEISSMYRQMEP